MKYYWIRIFDYQYERDGIEKGTLIEEYYEMDVEVRKEVKEKIKKKYSHFQLAFAKPKKKNGIYVILMESNKFFYDRFATVIDTKCFWCLSPIKGAAKDFPRYDPNTPFGEESVYFCEYACKHAFHTAIDPRSEGVYQEKEPGENGKIFGYVYLIYNRQTDQYYVGQTRYMPFFRWQEHIKDGIKGNIKDLVFSILTEVRNNEKSTEEENQKYLNNMEAWWIEQYIQEGNNVMNITKPKITLSYLKERFIS